MWLLSTKHEKNENSEKKLQFLGLIKKEFKFLEAGHAVNRWLTMMQKTLVRDKKSPTFLQRSERQMACTHEARGLVN